MKKTYTVFADQVETIRKQAEKNIAKAKKLGIPASFKAGNPYFKEIEYKEGLVKVKKAFQVADIEIDGEIQYQGWQYLGVLQFDKNTNTLHRVSVREDNPIPAFLESSDLSCSDCHKPIKISLYVVYNPATAEYKMLGPHCVEKFTNGLSINRIMKIGDIIKTLEANSIEKVTREYNFQVRHFQFYNFAMIVSLATILAKKIKDITIMGAEWKIYKKIKDVLANNSAEIEEANLPENIEIAQKAIEFYKNNPDKFNYKRMINLGLADAYIKEERFLGASEVAIKEEVLIKQEEKRQAKIAEEQAESQQLANQKQSEIDRLNGLMNGQFFGEVGKTYSNLPCTLMFNKNYNGGYSKYNYRIRLVNGTYLSFFTDTIHKTGPQTIEIKIVSQKQNGKFFNTNIKLLATNVK